MKHNWEILTATQADVAAYGWEERRRCTNCGLVQQIERDTMWMRTVSKRWRPLVGRCKGRQAMRASKENAVKAISRLSNVVRPSDKDTGDYEFIREFLTAACKKLPSEAAYEKDKKRTSKKAKAG